MCIWEKSRAITWKYSGTHAGLPIVVIYGSMWIYGHYGQSVAQAMEVVWRVSSTDGWMDGRTENKRTGNNRNFNEKL